jgi:hypothetical protein
VSTFALYRFSCPRCSAEQERELATSVNAVRSPHLREAVLAGSFQRFPCTGCGTEVEAVQPFVYVDFGRHQLIAVHHRDDSDRWAELEAEVAAVVADELRSSILADGLVVRLVFGLAALREKLLVLDAGFDDAAVEAVKLRVAAAGADDPPLAEVRVVAADRDGIAIAWPVPDGEAPALVRVPAADVDALAADPDAVAALDVLRAGPHVDLARLAVTPR